LEMSPRRRKLPVRERREPVGPWGTYVNDVRVRKGLSYKKLFEPINEAAHADGDLSINYGRHSVRNWLGGVLPHDHVLPWIAKAWQEPIEKVSTAVEDHRDWRYDRRAQAAGVDPPVQQPDEPAPTAGGSLPVYATLDPWPSVPAHSADYTQATDWPAWFGLRLAHVLAVVNDWQGPIFHADGLQALLHQEIMMFDAVEPGNPSEQILYTLSRRQALIALASLPLAFTTSAKAAPTSTFATADAFLSNCAASLTACWHLLKGTDLSSVDQVLSAYLVPLGSIAQRPSAHQQAAARLTSQAHRICGIVALHRNELKVRERHCQQAVYYAGIAADPSTEVSALTSLASTHFYGNDPKQAAAVYQRALPHQQAIPSLQRSRLHAELAVVYGLLGQEQDALHDLGEAEELYPDQPEQDRSFLYAEFTPASLALERGLTYVALAERYPDRGYQRTAMQAFRRVQESATTIVPDRIRCEILNHQAAAALLLNDLDAFEAYFTDGIEGARRLQSKQRYHETLTIWQRALRTWPRERRLNAVSDRFPLLPRQST
jgi:tetratricopeptide (TPR) repeat protein